jgi:hypothetical protein
MLEFLKNNIEFFLGIIVSFLGLLIPLWQYINTKKKEQQQTNLINFHEKIIGKISNQTKMAGLDEQVAVIFELRNFPMYSPVIIRILNDSIVRWNNLMALENDNKYQSLITEAKETIKFLNR